jgi:O-6-methylguanine DNA methyltransferase
MAPASLLHYETGPCVRGTLLVAHDATGLRFTAWQPQGPEVPEEGQPQLLEWLKWQCQRTGVGALGISPKPGPWPQAWSEVQALANPSRDKTRRLGVPVNPQGTAFELKVWLALQDIAPGCTLSYEGLAQATGKPTATRAVARACGNNPLALAIPCHRVIRKNGQLGGYRWGLAFKHALLEQERAAFRPPGTP